MSYELIKITAETVTVCSCSSMLSFWAEFELAVSKKCKKLHIVAIHLKIKMKKLTVVSCSQTRDLLLMIIVLVL